MLLIMLISSLLSPTQLHGHETNVRTFQEIFKISIIVTNFNTKAYI
jgi:hypothetical protein